MCLDEQGHLTPLEAGPMVLRRQDKPRVYARNGPAVLALRREVIEQDRLFGDIVLPLEMNRIASIDIDDLHDLVLAEFWIKRLLGDQQA